MIDPLAGPWTVRRNPKRGKRRIERKSPLSGVLGRGAVGPDQPQPSDCRPMPLTVPSLELIARADARYGVTSPVAGGAATATAIRDGAAGAGLELDDELDADIDADAGWSPPDLLDPEPGTRASATPEPDADSPAPSAPASAVDVGAAGARTGRLPGLPGLSRLTWPGRKPIRPAAPEARQRVPVSARVAIPLLTLLLIVAVPLVVVAVSLVNLAVAALSGSSAAASPLAVPAPPIAAGLPRRYLPAQNQVTLQLITEFAVRFSAAASGYHGSPGGLYREPGTIDPISDQPGWVEYLGYNAGRDLGAPSATVARLMASLIKSSAPDTSWRAAPGPRGGSARCAIAVYARTTVSICAWATSRNFGALLSPTSDTRGNELAVLMPQLRLDLQPG